MGRVSPLLPKENNVQRLLRCCPADFPPCLEAENLNLEMEFLESYCIRSLQGGKIQLTLKAAPYGSVKPRRTRHLSARGSEQRRQLKTSARGRRTWPQHL